MARGDSDGMVTGIRPSSLTPVLIERQEMYLAET